MDERRDLDQNFPGPERGITGQLASSRGCGISRVSAWRCPLCLATWFVAPLPYLKITDAVYNPVLGLSA